MDSIRSAMYFYPEAISQHATRHMNLKANALHCCKKKEEEHIVYDLSTYIFLFHVTFVLYAPLCLFYLLPCYALRIL